MSDPVDVSRAWTAAIDSYCERGSAAFWAEPVNAVTNVAFLIGAWVTWRTAVAAKREGDWAVIALVALQTAIGIGSFLFHTFANRWSAMADVIPIMLFIMTYLHLATVRYWRAPAWAGLVAAAAFIPVSSVAGGAIATITGPLNGSIGYVPTMLLLLAYGLGLAARGHPAGRPLVIGGLLLAVSLTFRTLDYQNGAVCEAFPLGTHWVWHLLNGLLLGWVSVAFVRHGARGDAPLARARTAG